MSAANSFLKKNEKTDAVGDVLNSQQSHQFPLIQVLMLLALNIIIVCICHPATAQSASASTFQSTEVWIDEYHNAFDKCEYPIPSAMRDFVSRLADDLSQTHIQRMEQENAYLRMLVADANTSLGDWAEAERDYLAAAPKIATLEQSNWIDGKLTGIYAMQGKWSRAYATLIRGAWRFCVGVVGPLLMACFTGLFLWQIGGWVRFLLGSPSTRFLASCSLRLLASLPGSLYLCLDASQQLFAGRECGRFPGLAPCRPTIPFSNVAGMDCCHLTGLFPHTQTRVDRNKAYAGHGCYLRV